MFAKSAAGGELQPSRSCSLSIIYFDFYLLSRCCLSSPDHFISARSLSRSAREATDLKQPNGELSNGLFRNAKLNYTGGPSTPQRTLANYGTYLAADALNIH